MPPVSKIWPTTVVPGSGITATVLVLVVERPRLSVAVTRTLNDVKSSGTVNIHWYGIAEPSARSVSFTAHSTEATRPLSVTSAAIVIVCPCRSFAPSTGEVMTTCGVGSGSTGTILAIVLVLPNTSVAIASTLMWSISRGTSYSVSKGAPVSTASLMPSTTNSIDATCASLVVFALSTS